MDNTTTRRDFVGGMAMGAGVLALAPMVGMASGNKRPNIIYIFTDQQSATMMGCAGNPWLKTPAMDYIANHGIRFERAYTTNPVCVPARIGMMSGRFPSAFSSPEGEVRENNRGMNVAEISEEVRKTSLGPQLKLAGYDLAYGGKIHLPEPLNPRKLGFEVLTSNEGNGLSSACVDYIHRPHDKPYCLIASFINPHDICYMALKKIHYETRNEYKGGKDGGSGPPALADALRIPDGMGDDEFFEKYCPPLPPNHAPQEDEPHAIDWLIKKRGFRLLARQNYTERDWRLHRWAYHRLTETVDRQIQLVLDAIKESGQEENTLIIFSSDHGDNDSSHKLEHKTVLYEEAARIPFMVMYKGVVPEGQVDRTHLVSNGLDLLPTILDYAGIQNAQTDVRGRSLRNIVEGREPDGWRRSLGVESQIGRMVVGDPYKYIRYDKGAEQEQLLDLKTDPNETKHFTNDPGHADALDAMRKEFRFWFPDVGTE